MSLESFNFIDSLNASNPTTTDNVSEGDDHIRGIKSTLKTTFPSINAAITATDEEINLLDGVTATTAELNILDGVTATTAELNIIDGVTATTAELNYVDGVTSNIQTQLGTKLPLAGGTMTGNLDFDDAVYARFGASDDLQIYHQGGNSHIRNSTGDLYIEDNDGNIYIRGKTGEDSIRVNVDGSVQLYNDNLQKLATTSTGIDVTGSVTCDGFTSTGIDDNATSTAITIDASENVTLAENSTLYSTGSSTWDVAHRFEQSGLAHKWGVGLDHSDAGSFNFAYDFSDAVSPSLTGNKKVGISSTGDVTLVTGNLVIGTSGKGIDFSATSDGSGTMTSEVLDDYEEGTWTPSFSLLGGTPVYNSANVGRYTKIGDTVHLQGRISWSSLGGGTSSTDIGGLPYTPQGGSDILGTLVVGYGSSLAITAGSNISGYTVPTSATIRVQNWDVTTGTSALTSAELSEEGEFAFAISYTA